MFHHEIQCSSMLHKYWDERLQVSVKKYLRLFLPLRNENYGNWFCEKIPAQFLLIIKS